jgi:UDP-N-acetylglucosamine 2-epimerase (non-hydrolysing)
MKKNICIVAGARPNFVKVAPLMRVMANNEKAVCQLVYAGKSDDPTLEPSLFDDLQLPRPDVFLGVDCTSLNEITSRVMAEFDHYLDTQPTDVVIVVDDLASTMAAAIVTKKRGVKLAHLVAGTRSFDINMPKEINRLVIDALSDYLFTAGVKSNSVATREQSETSQTYMVGNILMDNLRFNRSRLKEPVIPDVDNLGTQPYLVLTLNRKALLADKTQLKEMLDEIISRNITIIAPLRGMAHEVVSMLYPTVPACLHLTDSLPYLEFGWLTAHAAGIVTDSGNVAEEATFNSVPCITLNSYTEHQETVSVGSNVLVGGDRTLLGNALDILMKKEWKKCALPERWDGRAAERIVQILLDD